MAHIKIACISDTHDTYYPEIPADVDAVIHAGDITLSGSAEETYRFLQWYDRLPFKHKIFIGGNHDRFLEKYHGLILEDFPSIVMLAHDSYDLEGIKVWGSPVSPAYGHIRAFAREREALESVWAQIPEDVDIVVTHGPAHGIRDTVSGDAVMMWKNGKVSMAENLGDVALRDRLSQIAPQYHICGHIHGGRGSKTIATPGIGTPRTTYINAAVLNEAYRPYDMPVHVIEVEK